MYRSYSRIPQSKSMHIMHKGHIGPDPYTPNYEGGSICNENSFITPSTNALGFYAICQTKDQSVAFITVHETLVYLFKFNKLQTF